MRARRCRRGAANRSPPSSASTRASSRSCARRGPSRSPSRSRAPARSRSRCAAAPATRCGRWTRRAATRARSSSSMDSAARLAARGPACGRRRPRWSRAPTSRAASTRRRRGRIEKEAPRRRASSSAGAAANFELSNDTSISSSMRARSVLRVELALDATQEFQVQPIGEEVEADGANDEQYMHDRRVGFDDGRRWRGEVAARCVHGCAAKARRLRSGSRSGAARGGANSRGRTRSMSFDLADLLTAATFALLRRRAEYSKPSPRSSKATL